MENNEYQSMYDLESFHWWYRGLHELVLSSLKNNGVKPPAAILDAGCGTGFMMKFLQDKGFTVDGFDASDLAVQFCHQRGLKNVKMGDLNSYSTGKEQYDAVLCLDVLVHSGIPDVKAAVERLAGSVKPSGLFIFQGAAFPFLKRSHDKAVHGVRRFTKKTMEPHLRQTGFKIIKSTYRYSFLFLGLLAICPFSSGPDKNQSDLRPHAKILNLLLLLITRIENFFIKMGGGLPFGSSLFIVAQKGDSPKP